METATRHADAGSGARTGRRDYRSGRGGMGRDVRRRARAVADRRRGHGMKLQIQRRVNAATAAYALGRPETDDERAAREDRERRHAAIVTCEPGAFGAKGFGDVTE